MAKITKTVREWQSSFIHTLTCSPAHPLTPAKMQTHTCPSSGSMMNSSGYSQSQVICDMAMPSVPGTPKNYPGRFLL